MLTAGAAIAAMAADNMAFAGHPFADLETAHAGTKTVDFAYILMPHHHRHGDSPLRPAIPFPYMKIGAADRRTVHLHQNLALLRLGHGDLFHP